MGLTQKLQVRQSQALVMTPQLMQSIRLLQLGYQELAAFIEREIERNPLLEMADGEPAGPGAAPEREPAEPVPAEGADITEWLDGRFETSAAAMEARLGTTLENAFDGEVAAPVPPGGHPGGEVSAGDPWKSARLPGGGNGEAGDLEAMVAAEPTLFEYLRAQLALALRSPAERLIGEEIVGAIDDDGYLRQPLDDIAARLGAPVERAEQVLRRIQGFDPCGVGARDLAECLSLQLAERDRLDPAMQALIANLDLLARRDFATLMRRCGVDQDDLAEMVGEIRRLDPRPGSRFAAGPVQTAVADVIVSARPDGSWAVELNPETLPRVLVNRTYYARVSRSCRSEADKTFISDCLNNANWLAKSLDQRANTILKVAAEIVRQQDMFLAFGVEHLRPLNLRTVADAISMHESTVSRVTSNKFMLTNRGLFEMKYFFTAAIPASSGEDAHSAEAVRHRIRQLIEAESVDAVLSDDALVDMLRQGGIEIARRTVAKYRESMRIPSSVQRRREKRAFPDRKAS